MRPATCREVTQRKSTPWYTSVAPELRALRKERKRQERRRAERPWLASGLTVHQQIRNSFKHQITELVTRAKTGFYSSKVVVATACKELFRLTGSLMGKVSLSSSVCLLPTPASTSVFGLLFFQELPKSVMPLINRLVFHLPISSAKTRSLYVFCIDSFSYCHREKCP